MNKKVSAYLIFSLLIFTLLLSGCFKKDTSPLYGTFVYTNTDGSKAYIKLTKDNVYCENVNYQSSKEYSSFRLVKDYIEETEKKLGMEEFNKMRQEYQKNMEFESAFEKKYCNITETKYSDEYNLYNYTILNPKDNSYGLYLSYIVKSKSITCGDMVFEYDKNKGE